VTARSCVLLFALFLLTPACLEKVRPGADAEPPASARVAPLLVSNPDPAFDGSIRVASIFPTIGRYAQSGVQSENGTRLAIEDINRRGGIHGRRLRLLAYRTGSFFVDARFAAEKAVAEAQVAAILGSNSSSLSAPIAEIAERQGVVQISNISTAEDLTWDIATGAERRFVFRVCGSDAALGSLLAQFAHQRLQARRVAVLYEVGRQYSVRLAQNFIKHFLGQSAQHEVAEFFYLPRETDFRSRLARIAEFHPDAIFLPGAATDATLVAVQAEAIALRATLIGADGWSSAGLFRHGGPTRDAYFADLCFPPEPFGRRYQMVFGERLDGCRAVLAYDAVQALAQGLYTLGPLSDEDLTRRIAATRERLRAALVRVELRGQTGLIRFDRHRDRSGGLVIMQVTHHPSQGYTTRLLMRPDEL
jgi:branched-chain amino acid transport system substrate-binding protein